MGVSCAPVKEFESSIQVADCGMPLGQPESANNPAVHITKVSIVKIPGDPAGGAYEFAFDGLHCPDNSGVIWGNNS